MTITVLHVCAALVAVPCIIALAKATENPVRIMAGLAIAAVALALVGGVVEGLGVRIDTGTVGWVATGVLGIIAGIRIANPALTSLIITGGVLGALVELGIVASR